MLVVPECSGASPGSRWSKPGSFCPGVRPTAVPVWNPVAVSSLCLPSNEGVTMLLCLCGVFTALVAPPLLQNVVGVLEPMLGSMFCLSSVFPGGLV